MQMYGCRWKNRTTSKIMQLESFKDLKKKIKDDCTGSSFLFVKWVFYI